MRVQTDASVDTEEHKHTYVRVRTVQTHTHTHVRADRPADLDDLDPKADIRA